jgi:hypothetical protein
MPSGTDLLVIPPPAPAPAGAEGGPGPILRPRRPEDAAFLYSVAARWPESWLRVCRAGLPAPHQLEAMLGFGELSSRMVETMIDGVAHPVGLVTLYDGDDRSGTVWVDSVGLPGEEYEAARAVATVALVEEALFVRGFRKLYTRYAGYDAPPLGLLQCPVHEEVRMTEQLRHDDFWWDEIITAVYRDEWDEAVSGA